jgi:hypothetical protein
MMLDKTNTWKSIPVLSAPEELSGVNDSRTARSSRQVGQDEARPGCHLSGGSQAMRIRVLHAALKKAEIQDRTSSHATT